MAHDPRLAWAKHFGIDAERYHRTRPRYPAKMVERILDASPGRDVLDVGCGTGIVAEQFRAAGGAVLGVEPDERMAEFARRRGIDADVADFETWDARGRRFDVVTAGQTWHWVDPDAGAGKAAEVLRPGGRLAIFWNITEPPDDVRTGFHAAYQRAAPSLLAESWSRPLLEGYATQFTRTADGIRGSGGFVQVEDWRFEWEQDYTRDAWLDQVPTGGGMHQLPSEQAQQLLAGIGAAIDAAGGRFTMRYTTVVVTCVRR